MTDEKKIAEILERYPACDCDLECDNKVVHYLLAALDRAEDELQTLRAKSAMAHVAWSKAENDVARLEADNARLRDACRWALDWFSDFDGPERLTGDVCDVVRLLKAALAASEQPKDVNK